MTFFRQRLPDITPENSTGPAPDLSVIIVNYRCAEATIEAVSSVLSTAGALRIEVFVVDNDSGDDSVEVIRQAHPTITVIAAGHNGGYAWGNNVGIAGARGRHILVLNPDTVVHEGALEQAVAYLDAHPDVGVLGARVEDETGEVQQTRFRHPRLRHLFWRALLPYRLIWNSRVFGDQRYASLSFGEFSDVEAVVGCFMMVPRAVIAVAGAMDDRFFMYSEETEWCWRIRKAGYSVRYHPEIRITHAGGVATGPVSAWSMVETARSQILLLRLTRGPAIARTGTALLIFSDLLRGVWQLPQMTLGIRSSKTVSWRRRIAFLCKAFIDQPKGQISPPGNTSRNKVHE
mgnify:CR=1 FL=1